MADYSDRRRGWRRLALVLSVVLVTSAMTAGLAGADTNPHDEYDGIDFVLTVLHNNDGESEIVAGEVDGGGYEKGVAYFASLLRKAKKETSRPWFSDYNPLAKRGVVFVSSGDNFLASPAFQASVDAGIYYDAVALDRLRYDAIALGNHDFDFGPDVLAEFISEGYRKPGHPPYVSANLDFSGEPGLQALFETKVIAKSIVVKERGEKIGIVGATTPNLPFISSPRGVVVDPDVAAAVQHQIDRLERRGVNKIIMISHLQDIDADIALASELSGLDIMVAGGGDELLADPCGTGEIPPGCDLLLPGDDASDVFGSYPQLATNADGATVPVVTTSGGYGYVGQLVVGFDAAGNVVDVHGDLSGPRRVVSTEVGDDGVRANRKMQRLVVDPVAAFEDSLAATVIADSEVDLDGQRSSVRSMETNQGNLIADALLWQSQTLAADFGVPVPDVALQNGGGIRNDSIIPAGPITELDTFAMVPFPNFVTVFPAIPRSQFKEILENAVSRTQPGDIPGGTGRFAQVAGFSYEYSASGVAQVLNDDGSVAVAGTRVRNVVLDDGTVIVDAAGAVVAGDDITVTTIDFLARGGDQYPFRGEPFTVLGVSYQQALSGYIQASTADGGLAGLISAADYPEGGEGRIVAVS